MKNSATTSLVAGAVALLGVMAVIGAPNNVSPSNIATVQTPAGSSTTAVTEWYGPFASWDNIKTKYGAKGDGVTDDTAAIQNALNTMRTGNNSSVLYFPPGTYRVTQKLLLLSRNGLEFWGADPATTTLRWDGAGGGTLFQLDGSEGIFFGRLTFDGNNLANIAFDHSKQNGTQFDGNNVFDDCVFKNATYGVRGGAFGQGFASVVFNRCLFSRLTYGLSTWNWNALDGYLNKCVVEQCTKGLYINQGSSHAYGTIFRNNEWDIVYDVATAFFSAVSNTSYNSGGFVKMNSASWNSSPVLLKGNIVIDPTNSSPIQINQYGLVLMLDNIIAQRTGVTSPALAFNHGTWAPDFIAVGNTFTVANWASYTGSSIKTNFVDNIVVARSSLSLANPPNPLTATNLNRTTIDVATNASGATLQTVINNAAAGSVIHIPAGDHGCPNTITIPAGKALVLVGDGRPSQMVWNGGSGNGPLLQLPYPSQATLTHLGLNGNSNAKPIVQIDGVGTQAARVLIKDSWVTFGNPNIQLSDCPNAVVEQQSVSCQYANSGNAKNVLLEGRGKVRWFCTDTGDNNNNFVCTNGGTLYVETQWEEGSGGGRRAVNLAGNSQVSFVSTKIALNSSNPTGSMIQIANFSGDCFFAASGNLTDWLSCSGSGNGRVWATGFSSLSSLGAPYLTNTSSSITLVESMNQYPGSGGWLKQADKGTANAAYVRSMTSLARSEYPTFLPYARLTSQTDVLLHRVWVEQGQVNLWVKP